MKAEVKALYDYLKSKRSNNIAMTVEELRTILLPNKQTYPNYSNFKQSVLNPAIEEINKQTDRNVIIVEEAKNGTKVVNIKLNIKKKEKRVNQQTGTLIKANLTQALKTLESEELTDCLKNLLTIANKIEAIISQLDFLEDCKVTAENFVEEYDDPKFERYRERMQEKVDILEKAVDARNEVLDVYDNMISNINNMLEEGIQQMKDEIIKTLEELGGR